MTIIARIDQQIKFSPVFTDSYNNAVSALDAEPIWSISDPSIATLQTSDDGLSAILMPTGTLGTVQINMVIDSESDLDSDEDDIVGIAEVTFKAGKAAFVSLSSSVEDANIGSIDDSLETT